MKKRTWFLLALDVIVLVASVVAVKTAHYSGWTETLPVTINCYEASGCITRAGFPATETNQVIEWDDWGYRYFYIRVTRTEYDLVDWWYPVTDTVKIVFLYDDHTTNIAWTRHWNILKEER